MNKLTEIVTHLTKAEAAGDINAQQRLSQIMAQVQAEQGLDEYRRLTDLYWSVLDEARKELAQGKPEQQPQMPCPRTRKPKRAKGKTAKELGAYNKKTRNYTEEVLSRRNAI